MSFVATSGEGGSRYTGLGFMYVLATAGPEDLLKVGMTHDPLSRWSAFHLRWFEAFDLEHSLLVETETRADAQALETALHRVLAEHRCPAPLTMRLAAGGTTEWYRGAYRGARGFVMACEEAGYVVHLHARSWLLPVMRSARDRLDGIVRQAFEAHCSGGLSPPQRQSIQALVDAHRAFDADIEALVPVEFRLALGLDGQAPRRGGAGRTG